MNPGDEDFLRAATGAGGLDPGLLPDVRSSLTRAQALFGRPVPVGPHLLQQRYVSPDAVARAAAATGRDLRVCPHCWARVNVHGLPLAERFCCGGCNRLVAVRHDPSADCLAIDLRDASHVPLPGEHHPARTLAACGIELQGEAGFGGAGAVHRAALPPGRATVAVKILHADLGSDPQAVRRLLREARAAAALDHPHVVRVLHAAFTAAFPFLLLEWVDGVDLRQAVLDRGPLPPALALEVALGVARGLAAVHAAGLVHRDVKPSNILIPETGGARLTDFGLARAAAGESLALTRTGDIVGSPHYMAPEQWRDPRRAAAPADVYGLGACLFHMLTGRAPYEGLRGAALAERLARNDGPGIDADLAATPPELRNLVARFMAIDPATRPTDGTTAAREIETARSSL